jgi:integrase
MTNKSIERAVPDCTLRDNRVPGLILFVRKKSKTFYLYRNVHGRPRRLRLGKYPFLNVEQARKKAVTIGHEVETGTYGVPGRFGELWTLYCEVKRTKRTLEGDEAMYDKHLKRWADRRIDSVTTGDCQRLHAQLAATPYSANRLRSLLSTMFNLAVRHGLRRDNPVRAVTKYREQSRERFLTNEELPRFFSVLHTFDADFRDFVLLCLYTGARCGNVLAMHRDQIAGNIWTIPRTKSGHAQRVYLCREAVAILAGREGRVFERRSLPHKTWNAFRALAKLPGLRIHDLRRTLGSWQAATGASLPIIGKTLGHLSLGATQVYARLDLTPVQNAVDTAVGAMLLTCQSSQDTRLFSSPPCHNGGGTMDSA